MASTTHDGAPEAEGGLEGSIFKDNNGGVVVPLERDADMLIADYARKTDAPANSYSWKFIEDSLKNGIIQLTDRYRLGPDPDLPRPVGSGNKSKFRSPFTLQDDAAIARCALQAPGTRSGNNDRHPWQSWRDRFEKHFKHFSDEQLQALAARGDGTSGGSPVHDGRATATSKPRSSGAAESIQEQHREPSSPQGPLSQEQVGEEHGPEHDDAKVEDNHIDSEQVHHEGDDDDDALDDADNALEDFYRDLKDFAEINGSEFTRVCSIGGQELELFHLFVAEKSQEVPLEEVDWTRVAEDLEYERPQEPGLAESLKQCYEEKLANFVDAMDAFYSDMEEDEQTDGNVDVDMEEGDEEEEAEIPAFSAGQPSPSYMPSSPPIARPSKKRSGAYSWPLRTPKRRRLDRRAEIPSTPSVGGNGELDYDYIPSDATSPMPRRAASQVRLQSAKTNSQKNASPTPRQGREGKGGASSSRGDGVSPIVEVSSTEYEDGPIITTSPSTLKALPKATKRSLPLSFQKPPSPPKRAESDYEENKREFTEWMEHYKSLGFPPHIFKEAMRRTTMMAGARAMVVMRSLMEGQGVPENHEGIWTDRDDDSLRLVDSVDAREARGGDARKIRRAKKEWDRIVRIHGIERVEHRRRYLKAEQDLLNGRL